ncbi:Tigger transposable element-derived protein 3 [Mortierella sp. NVP85]|nr:Tigger transposable element-derived protein 3 [Mortierella sp. NVP85]
MNNYNQAQLYGDGDAAGFDIEAYIDLPEDDLLNPYSAPQEPVHPNDTVIADEAGYQTLLSTESDYSLDLQSPGPLVAMNNYNQAQLYGDGDAAGFDTEAYFVLPEDDLLNPYPAPQEPVNTSDTVIADETGYHNPSSTESARLQGADLRNVDLGELPYLKQDIVALHSISGEQQALSLLDPQLSEASIYANHLDRSSISEPTPAHDGSLLSPQQIGQQMTTFHSPKRLQIAPHIQQLKRPWIGELEESQIVQNHESHQQELIMALLCTSRLTSSSLPVTFLPDDTIPYKTISPAIDLERDKHIPMENPSLVTPKYNRKNEESDNGDRQKQTKRQRQGYQLQERLAIIEFWEENQNMSKEEISKRFNVPRTTIYGIIKDRDRLKHLATSRARRGLTLERCSTAESRFRILEELLVAWSHDIGSRGFSVTDQKITAQAFEIHRMLSRLISEPLPPCTFSPGWLQRFKQRQKMSLSVTHSPNNIIHQDDWSFPEDFSARFSGELDDIYMCGVTSMHLDMLPTRVYDNSCQESESRNHDAATVSVLLCCNATGSWMHIPYVFGREGHNEPISQQYYYGEGVNIGVEDIPTSELMEWLEELDKTLNGNIVLAVDQSTWGLFRRIPDARGGPQDGVASLGARLKNIIIVKVPEMHAVTHPMASGLAREFRLLYLNFFLRLDDITEERGTHHEKASYEKCLRLINLSWFNVERVVVKRSFEKVIERTMQEWNQQDQNNMLFPRAASWRMRPEMSNGKVMMLPDRQQEFNLHLGWNKIMDNRDLLQELKNALPSVPDTVIQYYYTQEAEIGPSSFLRTKIQGMQHHEDFGGCCFASLDFGRVKCIGAVTITKKAS